MRQVLLHHIEGLPAPIELCTNARKISDALMLLLTGWPQRLEEVSGRPRNAFLRIRKVRRGFLIERPDDGWRITEPDDLGIVCTTIVEIVHGFVEERPDLGLLHAGAAVFSGRLVLFPATNRAGKSTLVARLAAEGRRIFSDDLVPLDLASGEAVATGCLPRPRLPLPSSTSDGFRNFVQSATVASDGHYAYVDPGTTGRATHGERCRIGAIVLLERSDEPAPAHLEPASAEDTLWAMVSQDTRREYPAETTLESYLAIVIGVPCRRLVYSDLEDAMRCLDEAFAGWPDDAEAPVVKTVAAAAGPSGERCPVSLRLLGERGFLVNRTTQRIHALNPLGVATWRLLCEGETRDVIASTFAQAFPDVPPAAIASDVDAVIGRFAEEGLLDAIASMRA